MSTADRDDLAAILSEHGWHKYGVPSQPPRWYPMCGCGESFRNLRYDQAFAAHCAHVASVLAVHMAGAQAEAWDEGWRTSEIGGSCPAHDQNDWCPDATANPYRADRVSNAEDGGR